jgi:hypothetical protein
MRKLTDKQQAFCSEYVANGYNGAGAYRFAYGNDNQDVCKAEAYKMLRDPRIQDGIKNVELDYRITGHGLGINKEAVLNVIKRALDARKTDKDGIVTGADDHTAQLKAVEVYARLTGDFSAEKKQISIEEPDEDEGVSKMTPEEREAYKAKLLSEL